MDLCLRVRDIVPCSYVMMAFINLLFFSYILLKSSNHGFHRYFKRLSFIIFLFRICSLLRPTIASSRCHQSICWLHPLLRFRCITGLFFSKLKPSIVEPILNMGRGSRETKEELTFALYKQTETKNQNWKITKINNKYSDTPTVSTQISSNPINILRSRTK